MSWVVSVQGVSVQGVCVLGVCVLGVSVWGVHVRGGFVLPPCDLLPAGSEERGVLGLEVFFNCYINTFMLF